MIALAIEVEAEGWDVVAGLPDLCRRAAASLIESLPEPLPGDVAATLLFADDATLRDLNRTWRGLDRPTNVLSFPSPEMPGSPRPIGDVAIAVETVLREARAEGKSAADHAAHLVLHGLLHLLGHDHETDREADAMEGIETAALFRMGIADPYRASAA